MKKNDLSLRYTFRKINENINFKTKVIFSDKEKNLIFYATNNLIISYDISTSFIVERFRVSNVKIRSFHIFENFIFALDNNGEFIKFNMVEKQLESSVKLSKFFEFSKENRLDFFKFSKYLNVFLFITKDLHLLKIDFNLIEENSGSSNLKDYLEDEFKIYISKNKNKKIRFIDIDSIGKVLIFSIDKFVFCVNLLSNNISIIELIKPLSTGLFLEDTKFVVGDISGKIHFISNFFENNPFISTSHWHSHKVTSLEKDFNNEYLYSGGEEGVVVIWNLKSEIKSFLPRLGSEIMTISFTSQKTNILALTLKENSIRFINLFDSSFINDISGVSLNKFIDKKTEEYGEFDKNNFKKIKLNKNKYLLIFNEDIGKIQFLNVKSGRMITNLNLIIKNFTSKTENENVNLRKLKFVEVVNNEIIATYEEIKINEDIYGEKKKNNNFLTSVLKFWKISDITENNFTLELKSVAENPHNNESIKGIISHGNKLVTYSDSFFKVWDIVDELKQKCVFYGSYRKEKINSVLLLENPANNFFYVYTLHKNKFLVTWNLNTKEIENIYSFGGKFLHEDYTQDENVELCSDDSYLKTKKNSGLDCKILLKGKKIIILFNIKNNEIEYENNFTTLNYFLKNGENIEDIKNDSLSSEKKNNCKDNKNLINQNYDFKIIKTEFYSDVENRENCFIRFISKLNNSTYIVSKIKTNKGNGEVQCFFFVKRLYLRHLDFSSFKSFDSDINLIMINNNLDVLLTKRDFENNLLKIKLKRNTIDEEEIKENYEFVNNFDFYKHDENNQSFKKSRVEFDKSSKLAMELEEDNNKLNRQGMRKKDILQEGLKNLKIKK